MNFDAKRVGVVGGLIAGGAVALGLVLLVTMFWGAPLGTFFASFVKVGFVPLLLIGLMVGGGVWTFVNVMHNDQADDYYGRRGNEVEDKRSYVGGISLIVAGLVGSIVALVLFSPWAAMQYQDDISAVEESVPTFAQRPPYQQAEALLTRNKGGVQGVSTRPMFLGDRWSIVIAGDGTGLKSYGVVEWDGAGEAPSNFVRCEFGADTPAVYGSLWNSLVREARFAHGVGAFDLDKDDIYGYCDGEQAVMVVPLTRYVGVAPAKRVAAGVLLVRSGTDFEYVENVEEGSVPGPVYPESLVAHVESANASRDGAIGDIVFQRSNFLKADLEAGENPNSRNTGQFMLVGGDGSLYAVTPLVLAKSDGNQVVAVGVTNVSFNQNGMVNPLVIHMLPQPRRANAEIASLVQAEFSSLPWYAGLNVMEVIPVSGDEWVGYIGRDVSPEYRFTVDASNVICVYGGSSDNLLGCSNSEDSSGNGSDVDAGSVPGGSVEDLTVLSNEDLLSLRDDINSEIDRRLLGVEEAQQGS